jgi:SSS family transporter
MGLLNSLDIVVIVSYLSGITLLGSWFYGKNANMQEYLLGSKVMRWFPVALSLIAADTSAITYLGAPAWAFRENMKLNQNILAYLLAVPIVICLFLPIYSQGNLYTAYQYLERRFDLKVRVIASLFFLFIRGAHVSVIIYAPALMMSELMGVPLNLSILVMGMLTAFYTTMGGIKGVIWTDAIQVMTVLVGFTTVAVSVLNRIPGGITEVFSAGLAQGKFELFDFSLNADKVDNFWALMIGGTVLAVQVMSTDQAVLQKYFTTKSSKETSKSLLFYGAAIVPLQTFLSLLGVVLFVFYARNPDLRATLQNPDAVVPHYAAKMLPHGLAGLVVASIFAGSMSTVSASLNSLATSSVVDYYRRFIRPDRSDLHYTSASRWATSLWGAVATVGALFADRLGALLIAFTKIHSMMGGIILGIFLLGFTRRANSRGVMFGSAIGLAIVLYASFYTRVSVYWYCVIGCLSTVAAGWIFSGARTKGAGGNVKSEGKTVEA